MVSLKTEYSAMDVGYDPKRVEYLTHFFEDLIEKKKILSANYCLARDGKVFANNAVGKLSFREEDSRELQPDTIQKIASITKLFTAVAIWQLVEDGRLRVNQKVGEIIEEFSFPPFDEITVAHLLSHTSGLQPDYNCFEYKYQVSQWNFIQEDKGNNWIAASLRSGLRYKPGVEWAYSTFGFVILGEIISRVSGEFANDYIMEHIVKPCGLKDTGFDYCKKEIISRMNIPHERREKQVNEVLGGTYIDTDEGTVWEKIPATGGGLYSTSYDLCRFGTMLLQGGYIDGNRILGRKAIEKMTTIYPHPDVKDYCWNAGGVYHPCGLGPDMRCNDASIYTPGTYFHEGAGGCCLIIDPTEKMVAAWFVPYINDVWCIESQFHAAAVIWSGII